MIRLFRNPTVLRVTSAIVIVAFLLPLAYHLPILVVALMLLGLAYLRYWCRKRCRKITMAIEKRERDITYH